MKTKLSKRLCQILLRPSMSGVDNRRVSIDFGFHIARITSRGNYINVRMIRTTHF